MSKVCKSVYSHLGTQLALLTQRPKEIVCYGNFLLTFRHWKVSDHMFYQTDILFCVKACQNKQDLYIIRLIR